MASARAIERTFPGPRGDIWIDPPPANPASDYNNRDPKRLKKERARTATRHSPSPLRAPRPLPPCPPRAEPPPRGEGKAWYWDDEGNVVNELPEDVLTEFLTICMKVLLP